MKTFETYAEEDLLFIGLSPQGSDSRPQIEAWAKQLKIPWSLGFGAEKTLLALEVPGYPTTFVVGRDGKVVWHSFLGGSLDQAIRKAL